MVYVNKMDIMGANFYNVLNMLHERLHCNAVPIQLPIGAEDDFKGIVDLLEMKAYVYYDDLGKDIRQEEIPEDLKEKARGRAAEAVADEVHGALCAPAVKERLLVVDAVALAEYLKIFNKKYAFR